MKLDKAKFPALAALFGDHPALSTVIAKGYAALSNEDLVEMISKEAAKKNSKKLEKLRRELAYRKITPTPTEYTNQKVLKPWDGTRYTGMPKNKAKTTTPAAVTASKLHCDGQKDCEEPVTYIDNKGWVYCQEHGKNRTGGRPSRKLSPAELAKLESGGTIKYSTSSVTAHAGERIIYQTPNEDYRIVEIYDDSADMENLKGDVYNPKVNPDIPPEQLAQEEKEFEQLVNDEGVYGYELQKWNPAPGKGYEHVDSCWGFVGQYNPNDEKFNHYIVDELKSQIPGEKKSENATAGVTLTNESALRAFQQGFAKTGPKHGNEGTELRFEVANDMETHGSVNLHAESYFIALDNPDKAIEMLQTEGHTPTPEIYDEHETGNVDFDLELDGGFVQVHIDKEKGLALVDGWISATDEEDDESAVEESGEALGREMSQVGQKLSQAK